MPELLLSSLSINSQAVITRIKQNETSELSKLIALGLFPGSLILVHQTYPQIIISIGNTLLGIDQNIADLIYVSLK